MIFSELEQSVGETEQSSDFMSLDGISLLPEEVDIPEVGSALVYGEPFDISDSLDDHQGDNIYNAHGNCGLVSVMNIVRMSGREMDEDDIITKAASTGNCIWASSPEDKGGTNYIMRSRLLNDCGIPNTVMPHASLETIAGYVEAGHGVNINVNAGYAWDKPEHIGAANGIVSTNHSIVVTGTARSSSGELLGMYVCDSGLTDRPSAAYFMPKDKLMNAYVNAYGAAAVITNNPIR